MDIILIEPKHPGNIGSIARVMKNFGFTSLTIINPRCDVEDTVAEGFAMRGKEILKHARVLNCSNEKITAVLKKLLQEHDLVAGTTAKVKTWKKVFRVPEELKKAAKMLSKRNSVVIFGREDTGLTIEEMKACDIIVTIPTGSSYPTLNLSHAAAIILYEVWNAGNAGNIKKHHSKYPDNDIIPATKDLRHAFYQAIENAVKRNKPENASEASRSRVDNFLTVVKNLLERAEITSRDLKIIDGFLGLKTLKIKNTNLENE
ncbi:MAG: RNA methyltransferase [Promethearchaeota archaeon]